MNAFDCEELKLIADIEKYVCWEKSRHAEALIGCNYLSCPKMKIRVESNNITKYEVE